MGLRVQSQISIEFRRARRSSTSTPVVGHQHVVFDPDAAPAREIGAGLDREHHAGRDRLVVARRRPGRRRAIRGSSCTSMPEAVSGAVAERLAQPVPRQRVARRRVDGEPRRARRRPRRSPDRAPRSTARVAPRAPARPAGPTETVRVRSTQYES